MIGDFAERALRGFLVGHWSVLGVAVLHDLDRASLRVEGRRLADDEELRRRRDEKLRELNGRQVFSAGAAMLPGPDGRPDPHPALVVATDVELVVLEADPESPEDEIVRIPRAEVSGVRLLDEYGQPVVTPPSELEELDQRDHRYLVWVDREVEGETGGHAFVFLAYSVAAEAERRFRAALAA